MILRPVVYRRRVLPAERRRAAAILEQFGKSSLAFLTLLPDKLYFFSRSGQSFAAYTLVGNVAVVLGDPVGPDGDIPRLVAQFKTLCEKNDWHPVFYQVLPDYLPVYRDLGFKILKNRRRSRGRRPGFFAVRQRPQKPAVVRQPDAAKGLHHKNALPAPR
ncbi:MAG: phosphatidylglycerol lysyltransferase domain-containing protein [Desulfotomaculales bacterium]